MQSRMNRLLACCFVVFLFARGAAECRAAEADWEEALNGHDLAGWVVEGSSQRTVDGLSVPIWTVVDGELRCGGTLGTFGFLRLDRKLCDFALQAEFRPEKGANSGIGIRTVAYRGVRQTRPSFAAYEIQLQDDGGKSADAHSSGSLYRYVAPTESAMKPAGEWNTVEVRCTGPRIEVVINGRQVQDVDQSKIAEIKDKPLCGYVCLQNHGSPVAFRHVRLRVIKPGE
jgi:hypothetical protein